MSYQPLHHKYRPQTFAELVGQSAIATTLTNAINSDRIAPAYLFAGPRGTGKTSSARILAKSLNCLESDRPSASPCGVCQVCRAIAVGNAMDVIEIDAASNTGVDNIRDLIERSQFAPVQCRYKVYAIDECHMLSVAAFNALLKTLEEPPKRVVFVLATTDPQRVLPTIISRTQRFDFRRIPLAEMVTHLSKIAELEKINIDGEAVTLVAQIANGGLRDAQSLLDQLSLLPGQINSDRVWDLVGAVSEVDLLAMLRSIRSNQPDLLLQQCRILIDRGREPLVILQNLANFYLNLAIAKTAPQSRDLVAVTSSSWEQLQLEAKQYSLDSIFKAQQQLKDSEYQIKNSNVPRLWLEITLLSLLPSSLDNSENKTHKVNNIPTPTPTPNNSRSTSPTPSQTKKRPKIIRSQKKPKIIRRDPVSDPQKLSPLPTQSEADLKPPNNNKDSNIVSLASKLSPAVETPKDPPIDRNSNLEGLSLDDLWQKVINNIESFLTKPIVKDNCDLVAFQGSSATIESNSDKSYNMIRSYIGEIETAFTTVLGKKITVNLRVKKNKTAQIIPFPTSKTFAKNLPKNSPKTSQTEPTAKSEPDRLDPTSTSELIPSKNAVKTDRQEKSQPPTATTIPTIDRSEKQKPTRDNSSGEDLDECAERLAKFFEGEIIELDEVIENILVVEEKISSSNNNPNSKEIDRKPELTERSQPVNDDKV